VAVAVPVEPLYFQFDQQGVVFNMWYFAWFDEAMARFLGEAGYPYLTMTADGLDVQLVHTEADWLAGVRYGEAVLIDGPSLVEHPVVTVPAGVPGPGGRSARTTRSARRRRRERPRCRGSAAAPPGPAPRR
jgi:thioesterase superfamily protein